MCASFRRVGGGVCVWVVIVKVIVQNFIVILIFDFYSI